MESSNINASNWIKEEMTTDKTRLFFSHTQKSKNNNLREKEIIYAEREVKTSFNMIACQVVNIINF